eukprot:scaffold14741_cov55-Phaeocystis_antarctica.AAC.4
MTCRTKADSSTSPSRTTASHAAAAAFKSSRLHWLRPSRSDPGSSATDRPCSSPDSEDPSGESSARSSRQYRASTQGGLSLPCAFRPPHNQSSRNRRRCGKRLPGPASSSALASCSFASLGVAPDRSVRITSTARGISARCCILVSPVLCAVGVRGLGSVRTLARTAKFSEPKGETNDGAPRQHGIY